MTPVPLGRLLLASLPLALLAACGGGVTEETVANPPAIVVDVPASALATATSYTRYVASQTGTNGPVPLNLDDLTPPASDIDAPEPVL